MTYNVPKVIVDPATRSVLQDLGQRIVNLQAALDSPIYVQHASGPVSIYLPQSNTDIARGAALQTAFSASKSAGDKIFVAAGTYDLRHHRLLLAANVNLTLAPGVLITSTADGLVDGAVLVPGSNSIIVMYGAEICANGNVSSGYQFPMGTSVDTGDPPFSHVQVFGGTLRGRSDAFYIEHSDTCSASLRDVTLFSNWDTCVVTAGPDGACSHDVRVYNPRITVAGPYGAGKARGVLASDGATIRVFGGTVDVSLGGAFENAAAYAQNTGIVEFHGVKSTVANGTDPRFDLQNVSGTIKVAGGSGSGAEGAYLTSGQISNIVG